MARPGNDKYANIANAEVDVDNATYNFTELLTGISLGQGMGIIIDSIEYTLTNPALLDLDADGDGCQFAWTTSNVLSSIDTDQKGVIHTANITRVDGGTAANMWIQEFPITHQFFPPIIVAAPRLYLASYGYGAMAAGKVKSRLYFRYVNLTSQEYLEIAESFVLVG